MSMGNSCVLAGRQLFSETAKLGIHSVAHPHPHMAKRSRWFAIKDDTELGTSGIMTKLGN